MRRRGLLLLIDVVLICLATLLALGLRDNFETAPQRLLAYLPYVGFTAVVAVLVILSFGINRTIWRFSSLPDYLRLVGCVLVIVLGALAVGFLTNRLDGVARTLPMIQALLMIFALVGVRVAMRLRHVQRPVLPFQPPAATNQETVLLVGLNALTDLFLRAVAEGGTEQIRIAGIVNRGMQHSGRVVRQHPVLGPPEDLAAIIRDLEVHGVTVDRIVITSPFVELSDAARAALLEVERSSTIQLDFLAPRILGDATARWGSPDADAANRGTPIKPAFVLKPDQDIKKRYRVAKRFFDVLGAGLLLAVLLPILLVVAVLVVCSVGFPIVFWQQRPGLDGRPFRLFKFRTMRSAHDDSGALIADEDRVSRIGWALRRLRFDELPQLYNVLIGHMSFVGPRPLLPRDQSAAFAARLSARPGLTGWAQVNGGRDVGALDKAALDVWYLNNASLRLDALILLHTVRMVVTGDRTDWVLVRETWEDLRREGLYTGGESHAARAAAIAAPT